MRAFLAVFVLVLAIGTCGAQTPPSAPEIAAYDGLHAAAWRGNVSQIRELAEAGADPNAVDRHGRTPLHVAAFASHDDAVRALVQAGADPNLLENARYDIITIAAVADDVDMVRLAIELGGNAGNITSIYDGTALIAAAHLGHAEVVRVLAEAGAPLDHVNNLGWTALMEAVVLGDGGKRHTETVDVLVRAGADKSIPDRQGRTPLDHARERGFSGIIALLRQ